MSNLRIYCDMDQVLVNFLKGAKVALGKEFNDPALGSIEDRWNAVRQVENFWLNLEWMPEAKRIWDRIAGLDVYILTACPRIELAPTCAAEKQLWCQKNLMVPPERVHTVHNRKEKAIFAQHEGAANLLIDDHIFNVEEWIDAGGVAIHHLSVPETIQQLKFHLLDK